METTGIVRKIDSLGRILLPKEMRTRMQIGEKEPMEVFVSRDAIYLKKYSPGCILCGEMESATAFHGKKICQDCIENLKEQESGKKETVTQSEVPVPGTTLV